MNGEKNSHKSLSLPSLTALRCFEVAARTEHFGRAADELHLTHGAISRAVRLLEEIWASGCSSGASAGSS